jgi:hypothetical protein
VRVELATADAVKKHVNEVMDGWMRNMKLTAHQESAIGRARSSLAELTDEDFSEVGRIWSVEDEILPAQIVVTRWREIF